MFFFQLMSPCSRRAIQLVLDNKAANCFTGECLASLLAGLFLKLWNFCYKNAIKFVGVIIIRLIT